MLLRFITRLYFQTPYWFTIINQCNVTVFTSQYMLTLSWNYTLGDIRFKISRSYSERNQGMLLVPRGWQLSETMITLPPSDEYSPCIRWHHPLAHKVNLPSSWTENKLCKLKIKLLNLSLGRRNSQESSLIKRVSFFLPIPLCN
jgi:hypothetical protein